MLRKEKKRTEQNRKEEKKKRKVDEKQEFKLNKKKQAQEPFGARVLQSAAAWTA